MSKFLKPKEEISRNAPFFLIFGSFFLIELFGFFFLSFHEAAFSMAQLWPLAFGLLWAAVLSCLLWLLPRKVARILYAGLYLFALVYAGFQTGYFYLFSEMMWLSDFLYASEGAAYADMLLTFPLGWWLGLAGLIILGGFLVWKFPKQNHRPRKSVTAGILAAAAGVGAFFLPELVFLHDRSIQYAGSDYGRAQSAEAAYDNMFNTHRLYQVCGLYQTLGKDIYTSAIFPMTPGYVRQQKEGIAQIDSWFLDRMEPEDNGVTGLLKGKNVVLVLMESMDDWMIGDHTPTITKLMSEGVNFTNFYTPVYGGIRTFNTEFCINTGSFLSSAGGYAFDYVTNSYRQSLANQLRDIGYSAKTFHYNDPSFYSRGEFSPAMGYEEYVCYADFLEGTDEKTAKDLLYDDLLLLSNAALREEFFREGKPRLNFIITRSAHLSYKYNEVLSHWALKKYPEYRGMTDSEETDCALLKARLADDLFQWLLMALEDEGELENTVIIGVTDHYTYGYKDEERLLALSGVEEKILLEKTPCFIWSPGLEAAAVDKVLNTSDLLPTVLNLLGVDSPYSYMGRDAFDPRYEGFVPFSDGGWILGDIAYDASTRAYISISGDQQKVTAELQQAMAERVQEFIRINNLILETDYYRQQNGPLS